MTSLLNLLLGHSWSGFLYLGDGNYVEGANKWYECPPLTRSFSVTEMDGLAYVSSH